MAFYQKAFLILFIRFYIMCIVSLRETKLTSSSNYKNIYKARSYSSFIYNFNFFQQYVYHYKLIPLSKNFFLTSSISF